MVAGGPRLLSTAEYVAITEDMKEILYVKKLMEFIRTDLTLPVKLYCNNVGEVFLANKFV